jgi:hypothetical protein
MNSSIAASMMASRRSAARSARLEAGFAAGGFGDAILDVAAEAVFAATRPLAGFEGLVVLGGVFFTL